MKIQETITRDCCQLQDLRPYFKSPLIGKNPKFAFCRHCGQIYHYEDHYNGTETIYTYQPKGFPWEWFKGAEEKAKVIQFPIPQIPPSQEPQDGPDGHA